MQGLVHRAGRGTLVLAVALAGVAEPSLALSPEEFAAMEPEAALQLPVVETLSVFGWRKQEFVFVLENALIDLRYLYRAPSGHTSKELTAAVKAFQRDIGATPTGVLLVSQFIDLGQRGNEFWQSADLSRPGQRLAGRRCRLRPGDLGVRRQRSRSHPGHQYSLLSHRRAVFHRHRESPDGRRGRPLVPLQRGRPGAERA